VDGPRVFTVDLPAEWQESKLRLAIEGVRIPGNVPLKLRVTTIGEDEKEISLGSVGIEAIGPSKTATRSLRTLRLDVTRTLKRFLEHQSNQSKVDLRIQPVDGRNNPIRNLKWSVEAMRLEIQPANSTARVLGSVGSDIWSATTSRSFSPRRLDPAFP
jgi:hypothetical protein